MSSSFVGDSSVHVSKIAIALRKYGICPVGRHVEASDISGRITSDQIDPYAKARGEGMDVEAAIEVATAPRAFENSTMSD